MTSVGFLFHSFSSVWRDSPSFRARLDGALDTDPVVGSPVHSRELELVEDGL